MNDLRKELLINIGSKGPIGDLAKELEKISDDHKSGFISNEDARDLMQETINSYKGEKLSKDENILRWIEKIAILAASI